jgi:hypothetical protein
MRGIGWSLVCEVGVVDSADVGKSRCGRLSVTSSTSRSPSECRNQRRRALEGRSEANV